MTAPPDQPQHPLGAAEPVVPVIFPKAARIIIRDRQRYDEFWVLEPKLCRNSDLHRVAELARQYLIGESEGHNCLRVKRRRHVDASVIPVGADESDILFCEIGFYMLEKDSQRAAAPFADPAPTLNTDMPGDLRGVRQLIEIVDRPRPLVADRAAKLQPVGGRIELRCLLFRID